MGSARCVFSRPSSHPLLTLIYEHTSCPMNQFGGDPNQQLQVVSRHMQRSHVLRIDAFVQICKYYFWEKYGQQFFMNHCEDVVITGGVSDKAKFFELCYPRNWRTFFNAVVKDIKGIESDVSHPM